MKKFNAKQLSKQLEARLKGRAQFVVACITRAHGADALAHVNEQTIRFLARLGVDACQRFLNPGKAHQRLITERKRAEQPREALTSLDGFTFRWITRAAAKAFIVEYEWLGTIGRAFKFVGMFTPDGELVGGSCFGWGPASKKSITKLLGGPAWCLERGATAHYLPKDAASFQTAGACKFMYEQTGIGRFYAYADKEAGEIGTIYQACNWFYLGQGLIDGEEREHRQYVVAPGLADIPQNRQSTWELRQQDPPLSIPEALDAGWIVGTQAAKHLYATNIGRDRKSWRKKMIRKLGKKDYPKRDQ